MDALLSSYKIWKRSSYLTTKAIISGVIPGYALHICWRLIFRVGIPKRAPGEIGGAHMSYSHLYLYIFGLVLNLMIVSITPQYHLVYDDIFKLTKK